MINEPKDKIFEFFDNISINSPADFDEAVLGLRRFGRRIWIAGAVGAIDRAIESFSTYHFSEQLIAAHRALQNWIRDPRPENAELARRQYFPYRQLLNCDDIRNLSNRAASFAVAAISETDEESFRLARVGMLSMAHEMVLGEKEAWSGIEKTIKSLFTRK
ncbi:MAG: hypothetical protein JSS81_02270 [Acidobacteria bacterium]|nr:hypothetical protein [Acidobacteriota bacterium]